MRYHVALANALLMLVTGWIVPTTTAFVAPFPATTTTTIRTTFYETSVGVPLEPMVETSSESIIEQKNLTQSLLSMNTTAARIAHHVVHSLQCAQYGVTYTIQNIYSAWVLKCLIPTAIVTNLLAIFLTLANSNVLNVAYVNTLKGIAILCDTYFGVLYSLLFRAPVTMLKRFLPQKRWIFLVTHSYIEEAIYRVIPCALLILLCTKVLGKKEPDKVLERRWDTFFTFVFGFNHLTNHISLTHDVATSLPNSYSAVHQSVSAFLISRSLFLPLFKSHGFAAAAAAHAILNILIHLMTPTAAISSITHGAMIWIMLGLLWKPAGMVVQGGKNFAVADPVSLLARALRGGVKILLSSHPPKAENTLKE